MNSTNTQLSLNSGNKRRSLERGTDEGFESTGELRLAAKELIVEADDADVLLTGTLLRLHEAGCTVDADNQAARDLWVESATVAGLLDAQYPLNPCDNLVAGGLDGSGALNQRVWECNVQSECLR